MSSDSQAELIVGVGASAGGLVVLKALMRAVPADTRMSFLIIQHLDPAHKSLLSEILAKEAPFPVMEARQGLRVKPGHAYVIPPDAYLEVIGSHIRLSPPELSKGTRRTIDHCFRSLAREWRSRCAGIILSGSGNDGTAGLRAIRAAGGLTLAQQPASAEHHSMPTSAIDAGVVDKVAEVADMPAILQRFAIHAADQASLASDADLTVEDSLEEITTILHTREKFNLLQYKPSTVQRRIARRMGLASCQTYADYLELLRHSQEERRLLTRDLLINVTEFMRDPEAFELLEQEVLPDLIEQLPANETIRVWVPGCASGEEAYTLAILLLEALDRARRSNRIKIFATDIDVHAIQVARRGVYPASIAADLPRKYLDKYFTMLASQQQYRIKNQVRDLIAFAIQNVVTDPPFSHMHLISCRNLLIYLKKEVQQRVLSAFYFALHGPAYLLLGSSETVGTHADAFKTLSKKWRIYQKVPGRSQRRTGSNLGRDTLFTGRIPVVAPTQDRRTSQTADRNDRLRRAVLDAVVPAMVVVDPDGKVRYYHGRLKPFLTIPAGEPRHDIGQLIIPELRIRIRTTLYKLRKTGEPQQFRATINREELPGAPPLYVRVEMRSLRAVETGEGEAICVLFYEEAGPQVSSPPAEVVGEESLALQQLEQELAETKEELQHTIEDLETSTEELKAAHEEALSTNEELQSTNEELEANSEELRSLNEELNTVNAQLKDKIIALQKANNDVENFFTSTNVPTVFLSSELKIQRFTPAAAQLLHLKHQDMGRPIYALESSLIDESLAETCREVLQSFQPQQVEIQDAEGRWFVRRISPYRTEDRRIDGVVLLYQDVTQLRALSARAETREKQQLVVAQLGLLALSGVEPEELMEQAVRQVAYVLDADYCKVLKYQPPQHNLLMLAGVGWREGLVGQATVPDDQDSQAGYTLLAHEPVIVRRLSEERRFRGPDLLIEHDVVSGISCIINHSEPPYGVLGVHTRAYREFSDDDANFLVSVANMLSTALRTRQTRERLNESELEFRTLANSIPQLAWMADEKGFIYWYNQRWYDYTGTNPEDMEGWGWQQVHRPDLVARITDKFKRHIELGEEWEDTFPLRSRSGEYRWFLSRAMPIRDSSGQVIRWFGTNTDIHRQLEYEQALRESEEKLRIAMETNRLGAFEYYIESGEIIWDQHIRSIWGMGAEEVTTFRLFIEGLHPDDREQTLRALNRSLNPEDNGHYHSVYRVINRQTHDLSWVEASGQVFMQEGRPYKMIGLVIDITERKRLEASLRAAIAELEMADKQKNEFLAILGHELRNPLAALRGSVELMERGISQSGELLQIMQGSIRTMAKLLDDLLDLSRMARNRIQLDLQRVDLSAVAETAVLSVRALCQEKQQQLNLDLHPGCYIQGDPTRLEQIVSNLLGNASKYSPAFTRIELSVQAEGDEAVVRVRDEGVGISAESLERIFDPFYQVAPGGKAASGLGIGLALAKDLTLMHGGSIRAYSAGKGQGALFELRFPSWQEVAAGNGTPPTPATEVATVVEKGMTVVLIEDNPQVRTTFSRLLESLHCVVHTADNGRDGLQLILEYRPTAAVIDIGLPDLNGYELARQLRAADFAGLLIAISGYSHSEAREQSLAAGFDHHLAKPATLEEVARLLATRDSL